MQNVLFESQFERITSSALPLKYDRKVTITPIDDERYELAIVRQQVISFENKMNQPMEATFIPKLLERLNEEFCHDHDAVEFTDGQISISFVAKTKYRSIIVARDTITPDCALGFAKVISDSFESTAERNFEYRINAPLIIEAIMNFNKPVCEYNQPILENDCTEIAGMLFSSHKNEVVEPPVEERREVESGNNVDGDDFCGSVYDAVGIRSSKRLRAMRNTV